MSTTAIGKQAEAAVAAYLQAQDYTIVAQNWRTRWCEIDIVARKNNTIYFVEVKYRKTNMYGDGLAYITPKKLQQMSFAAEMWVNNHNWRGQYALVVAAVTGRDFQVEALVEL